MYFISVSKIMYLISFCLIFRQVFHAGHLFLFRFVISYLISTVEIVQTSDKF
jgi:hypothetical protein